MPSFTLSMPQSRLRVRRVIDYGVATLGFPPQPKASSENAAINVTETDVVDQLVETAENAGVNVTETDAIAATLDTAENAGVNVTETDAIDVIGDFPPRRVRLDVYSADGTVKLGAGPVVAVLEGEYDEGFDQLGIWSVAVPAADTRAASLLQHGNRVWIYRESEGLCFRGTVDALKTRESADGSKVLVASGFGLERQLMHVDTLPGREYSETDLVDIANDLVGLVSEWSVGTVAALQLTYRPESMGVYRGLAEAARILGIHLRTDNRTMTVDVDALGEASGLVLANVGGLPVRRTYRSLYPIADLEIEEESAELWNQLIIFGAGEGVSALTLRESTRVAPYTIQTDTGPDGRDYYWLEDAASVAAYGPRRTTRRVTTIAPLANTAAARVEASNTLYDVGAAWLSRQAQVRGRYAATPLGLKHIDALTGAQVFKVGQKLRLAFRGVTTDREGNRTSWRKIDAQQWILGFRRTFNPDGSDAWSLRLASVDRPDDDEDQVLADAISQVRGLAAGLKPFVGNLYSMGRGSVDGSFPLDFLVDFDDNVQTLIQSKLRWALRKVRSNATGAASGGGSTSGGGSSHSHTVSGQSAASGGGSTSGAGSSHSHTVSGGTADSGGTHRHQMLQYFSSNAQTSGNASPASTQDVSQGHTHTFTGSPTDNQNQGHTHSMNNHGHAINYEGYFGKTDAAGSGNAGIYGVSLGTGSDIYTWDSGASHSHSLSGITNAAETSHTHSVSAHTHSVDAATSSTDTAHTHSVSAHTHALSFGIFEGGAPVTPAIHVWINGVDRSVALGGPWNDADVEVDITDYLTDPANPSQPLRQSNVVRFTSSELLDVDAVVRSLVTASAIAPV